MPEDHEHPEGSNAEPPEGSPPEWSTSSDEPTKRFSGQLGDPADETVRQEFPTTEPDESDSERTQRIPAVSSDPVPESDTETTQSIPAITDTTRTAAWSFDGTAPPPDQPPGTSPPQSSGPDSGGSAKKRRTLIRSGVAAGVAVGLLALLYIGDLAFSSGQVPRGTVVGNVAVGGLNKAAAERKLREELGPGLNEPVVLRAGADRTSLDPSEAGLSMDWDATLDKAGSQPLNPFTRLSSFFTSREITPVSNVDRAKLNRAVDEVVPRLEHKPSEGTIRFDDAEPVAVEPVTGHSIDTAKAADAVLTQWAGKGPVQVPFVEQPVSTTSQGVHQALNRIAKPAVSAPVTVLGDGAKATLTPEMIADALRFNPDGNGGLKMHVDRPTVVKAAEPQLASTIRPGKDAGFVVKGGKPVVQKSVHGRGIDWKKSLAPLSKVLRQQDQSRSVRAVYVEEPAKLTTEEANKLGIREKVSTFTTRGFGPDSGVNIRRVAQEVNGAIIKPGKTFSLNGHTGIRQKPQGYIASGIIKNGRPSKAVGGGISQFATTLYNASYFAGLKDVEHKEHSYYISRYPMGREATVFQQPDGTSLIDVKFKNTLDSGILITTKWTPESITVTFWGTKKYDVKSHTSPKSPPIPPEVTTIPPGQPCKSTDGKPGFTVTDTRTRTNVKTGEVTKNSHETEYEAQPIVKCGAPPPPPPPGPPAG
ncbi:vancomycin resistance protein YoaR [Saccharopolyspora lacisalsi]|uniref:Vancomycin resistance protein YoaR n=1 Tax=Halosaccharopolyspora lacisalsi TaxID=1000566 RepID=A0A839E7U2_9PSEU|nr:VanW family protein [Halosaccharopolyspora lacisalsi]MBA8827341.1 vancomycin resistance protein YoaR [Halosaccharopolyspora lacisalsi]